MRAVAKAAGASALYTPIAACGGIQSALRPAGVEAEQVAHLFLVMLVAGAAIWSAVVGLLIYALRGRRKARGTRGPAMLIFWGGAVFPSVALALLLGYALWLMPRIRPWFPPDGGGLRIEVTGHRFWWRVVYRPPGGRPVVSANEIRLPVGQRVELVLTSADVIHSFWIPTLGGKMDMIPGRTNHLWLEATEAGTFRGPCTEFCGTSHALMAFPVVTMPPDEFNRWLADRAAPSPGAGARGRDAFLRHGCGACHAVGGTEAAGVIGPDLSHVGSRLTIGAGILTNGEEALARFIAEPDKVKPGVEMPGFGMLPPDEIRLLAAYLRGLR
jgi:cytochrome c oxidase subunit 2